MNETEAKTLAAEFEHNRVWQVLRINHGIDPLDGWYVVVALHHHASYRVLMADHTHATPKRLARCQLILEERVEQQRADPDAGMLLVPSFPEIGYEAEFP